MTPAMSMSLSMSRGNYPQCYENINSTTATTRIAQSTVSTTDGGTGELRSGRMNEVCVVITDRFHRRVT